MSAAFIRVCLAVSTLGLTSSLAVAQVPLGKLDPAWIARLEQKGGALFTSSALAARWNTRGVQHHVRSHWLPMRDASGVLRAAKFPREAELALGLTWSPPRRLLLDRARGSLRLDVAESAGAGRGQGVVIGIVDSGVDISHPDLRNADGTTRVAWWIDFTQNPAGRQPQLESALGCSPEVGLRCQIASAADLDELLQNGVAGDEPRDPLGHGTHITSIAAGNGLAGGLGLVGIAPEATLIIARVTGAGGTIADSDVVLATEFVFERAAELGMPAVVNLSLGGDFGAHDGSSELSRALAGFVGSETPGRAIVVAGGNSGEVLTGLVSDASERLGIHTEVAVKSGERRRVPLLTPLPASGADTTRASLFIWVNLYPADRLSIGLTLPDGSSVEPIALGQVESTDSGELAAIVLHGLGDGASEVLADEFPELSTDQYLPRAGSAVILVDGAWTAGGSFEIVLEGEGRAEAWVQSEGDLAPEAGSLGALFPRATAAQTVTIPASDADLIAVGASINRIGWTAADGTAVNIEGLDVDLPPTPGAAAFFSSAGPNAAGDVKPDLLAPGGFVIAAMARAADPRSGGRGVFSSGVCLGAACQVVSDNYAVTAGTSMAAPMVSGAVALLLAANPALTLPELRALLQAGSRPLEIAPDVSGREGGGMLDVAGAFEAASAPLRGPLEQPDPEASRIRAAGGVMMPDASRSLVVQLWLRDREGVVFDAALARLRVEVRGGELRSPLSRTGPGLYAIRVGATSDAADSLSRLEVFFDEQAFVSFELPVEVIEAPGVPEAPRAPRSDGGCAFQRSRSPSGVVAPALALGCSLLGAAALRRARLRFRRCKS